MARRIKRYRIATQNGVVDDDLTKLQAQKDMAKLVRESAAACRRAHKTCSVVGTVRSGSVQIKVGGRQGYHLWQRFIINPE